MILISAQQPSFQSCITLKFQGSILASSLTLVTVCIFSGMLSCKYDYV